MLKLKNKKKGFTLVETMIAFLTLLLVTGAALQIFKDSITSNNALSANLNSQGEIRNAFKSMSAGLRSASPSSLGAYPIASAGTSSLIYYSDIDGDNLMEQIRYFLSADILKMGILKPSGNPLTYNQSNEIITPLLNNIVNSSTPIFEYYNGSYDGDTESLAYPLTITNIRLIKITALINQNPKIIPAIIMEFITQVSIRNLKDNL
ncbi:MAG: type II secretion system protein [Patescibacteria group bacterium]|jgi:type II secretory pathway pseudopilin PulG